MINKQPHKFEFEVEQSISNSLGQLKSGQDISEIPLTI